MMIMHNGGLCLYTGNTQFSCADLHLKKRKREEANLNNEIRSADDMSLDEGEIPTGHQDGGAGVAFWLYNAFGFFWMLCD